MILLGVSQLLSSSPKTTLWTLWYRHVRGHSNYWTAPPHDFNLLFFPTNSLFALEVTLQTHAGQEVGWCSLNVNVPLLLLLLSFDFSKREYRWRRAVTFETKVRGSDHALPINTVAVGERHSAGWDLKATREAPPAWGQSANLVIRWFQFPSSRCPSFVSHPSAALHFLPSIWRHPNHMTLQTSY